MKGRILSRFSSKHRHIRHRPTTYFIYINITFCTFCDVALSKLRRSNSKGFKKLNIKTIRHADDTHIKRSWISPSRIAIWIILKIFLINSVPILLNIQMKKNVNVISDDRIDKISTYTWNTIVYTVVCGAKAEEKQILVSLSQLISLSHSSHLLKVNQKLLFQEIRVWYDDNKPFLNHL